MKPISEMTPEELRREIAEALGYTLEKKTKRGELKWKILSPEKHIIRQATVKEDTPLAEALMWFNIPPWRIPDWPHDPGAALMLCQEIAQKRGLHLMLPTHPPINGELLFSGMFVADVYPQRIFQRISDITVKMVFSEAGKTIELALSRLALAALREKEIKRLKGEGE